LIYDYYYEHRARLLWIALTCCYVSYHTIRASKIEICNARLNKLASPVLLVYVVYVQCVRPQVVLLNIRAGICVTNHAVQEYVHVTNPVYFWT
jgi:hypothetical protein